MAWMSRKAAFESERELVVAVAVAELKLSSSLCRRRPQLWFRVQVKISNRSPIMEEWVGIHEIPRLFPLRTNNNNHSRWRGRG